MPERLEKQRPEGFPVVSIRAAQAANVPVPLAFLPLAESSTLIWVDCRSSDRGVPGRLQIFVDKRLPAIRRIEFECSVL